MLLSSFYQESSAGVLVSPAHASRFAKEIAGDFNPIHDPGAKRFCVPGDLLFSLVLDRYGLSEQMEVRFTGMVGEGVVLEFPATGQPQFSISDATGKTYLEAERSGRLVQDPEAVWAFARAYVAFSGQTFPHLLVPLLREQGVMINPERPLVIYERMSIRLSTLDIHRPRLESARHQVKLEGKRAEIHLGFRILDESGELGTGSKKMLVSSLKPYDEARSEAVIQEYRQRISGWQSVNDKALAS